MKIIVIGGAHAGLSAVNAFRRVNTEDEIVIYEKNHQIRPFISAGIKLALAGEVKRFDDVNFEHYEDSAHTSFVAGAMIDRVDTHEKMIYGRMIDTGEIISDHYDKLVYALGSSTRVPSFVGSELDQVVFVKDEQDAAEIMKLAKGFRRKVLVYGGGPVSIELAATLAKRGLQTSFVTRSEKLMVRYFDEHIQNDLDKALTNNHVAVRMGTEVVAVENQGKKIAVTFSDGSEDIFDFMAIASGLQPNTMLLAGQVDMTTNGAVLVNDRMQTSDPDVYAIGDAAVVNGKFDQYFPLLSAAFKMGRVAGYSLAGLNVAIQPILRTIGFNIFDRFYYKTGLTKAAAIDRFGKDVEVLDYMTPATIHAMEREADVHASIIFNPVSGRLYGAQISTNAPAAAEVITTLSHAVSSEMTVQELAFLDTYFESEINLPYSVANRLGELGVVDEAARNGQFNVHDSDENAMIVRETTPRYYADSGQWVSSINFAQRYTTREAEGLLKDSLVQRTAENEPLHVETWRLDM
jgi:NADPH-dependent 2,4-dienoyl-CoA reductase/sulfur reductase-like enzyme